MCVFQLLNQCRDTNVYFSSRIWLILLCQKSTLSTSFPASVELKVVPSPTLWALPQQKSVVSCESRQRNTSRAGNILDIYPQWKCRNSPRHMWTVIMSAHKRAGPRYQEWTYTACQTGCIATSFFLRDKELVLRGLLPHSHLCLGCIMPKVHMQWFCSCPMGCEPALWVFTDWQLDWDNSD